MTGSTPQGKRTVSPVVVQFAVAALCGYQAESDKVAKDDAGNQSHFRRRGMNSNFL
jgi:hypothetical protein